MRNGIQAGLCLSLALIAFSSVSHASIDPTTIPITKFLEVTPDIYRGARPTAKAVQDLAKEGLRTIIDLEDVSSVISSEQKAAKAAGLQFISKPMSGHLTPNDQEVDSILALMEDPGNYPLFIHCQYGEDRSGLLVALYRVKDQKWTADAAYQEWAQDGFHTFLTALKDYFDQKVGTFQIPVN